MIADIGLMVGMYIITRMFSILVGPKPDGRERLVTQIFAALTLFVTGAALWDLLTTSSEATRQLQGF